MNAALGVVPLATLGMLPSFARAHLDRNFSEKISLPSAAGRSLSGYLAEPQAGVGPAVLVFHDYWGANSDAKALIADLARKGYIALMPDLFNGKVARNSDEANQLSRRVSKGQIFDVAETCRRWLSHNAHTTGPIGLVGVGTGGAWALRAARWLPFDATAVYFCEIGAKPAAPASSFNTGPLIGHFSRRDPTSDKSKIDTLAQAMAARKQPFDVYWYDAKPGFTHSEREEYDHLSAKLSWARTLAFLDEHLRR